MSNTQYFSNKFTESPQRPLTFDIGNLSCLISPNCGFSSWFWWNL